MPTTIQIQERTLELLKKIKEETTTKDKSLAGYLGKKPVKWILSDLRDKNDRY